MTKAAFLDGPHASHTEQFIVDALRTAGALTISLVAEDAQGQLVGHVGVSPLTIAGDAAPDGWYGIGPLSVAPEHQRRGVGSLLMRAALARLVEIGATGCVLVGDPAYYTRFGFRPAAPLVLPDVPPVYFQAIAFSGTVPTGVVSFHPGFDATS